MIQRITAAALATVTLTLVGCGTADTDTTETVTDTVTTSTESSQDDTLKRLRAAVPAMQVNDDNVERECILAIADKLPETYQDMDFPEPIEFPESKGKEDANGVLRQSFISSGDFKWQDASGVWQESSYFCSVQAEDGAITERDAAVF